MTELSQETASRIEHASANISGGNGPTEIAGLSNGQQAEK